MVASLTDAIYTYSILQPAALARVIRQSPQYANIFYAVQRCTSRSMLQLHMHVDISIILSSGICMHDIVLYALGFSTLAQATINYLYR